MAEVEFRGASVMGEQLPARQELFGQRYVVLGVCVGCSPVMLFLFGEGDDLLI